MTSAPAIPHPKLTERVLNAATDAELHRGGIDHVEYNPRQISPAAFKRLCDSVRKFGLVIKPVVNRRSEAKGFPPNSRMVFVGGNQRVDACDSVFETQDYRLRCSLVDVDERTERELCIALNNASMQGVWDVELLGEVIGSIADDGGDVRDTGFSVNDLRMFMDDDQLAGVFEPQAEQAASESETVGILNAMRDSGKGGDGAGNSGNGDGSGDDLFGEPDSEATDDDGDNTQAIRDDLKRKRAKYKGQQSESDNADFTLHLVFDDRELLLRFIDEFGLDPAMRFIDGVDFTREVLDVDLREDVS